MKNIEEEKENLSKKTTNLEATLQVSERREGGDGGEDKVGSDRVREGGTRGGVGELFIYPGDHLFWFYRYRLSLRRSRKQMLSWKREQDWPFSWKKRKRNWKRRPQT